MGIDPDQVFEAQLGHAHRVKTPLQRPTHVLAATRIRRPTSPQRLAGLPAIASPAIDVYTCRVPRAGHAERRAL
jgi:hypothetical protein